MSYCVFYSFLRFFSKALHIWKYGSCTLINTSYFKAIQFLQGLGHKLYRLKKDEDIVSLEGLVLNKDALQKFTPDNFIFKKRFLANFQSFRSLSKNISSFFLSCSNSKFVSARYFLGRNILRVFMKSELSDIIFRDVLLGTYRSM